MAVRPKRASPLSTRPFYLPRVAAKELLEAAKGLTSEAAAVSVFTDGGAPAATVEALLPQLAAAIGQEVEMRGPVVAVLSALPQGEVRQAVGALGNGLAWARVKDSSSKDYRTLPLRAEVDEEEAGFLARSQPSYEGVAHPLPALPFAYDAYAVQAAFSALLREPAVLITSRRLVTWDGSAECWSPIHVVPGTPALVSVADGIDALKLSAGVLRP